MTAVQDELREQGSPQKALGSGVFFKTGPGQYGEGDVFLGVTVPEQRIIAKRHLDLSVNQVEELLQSPEHEFRMMALLIWTYQFARGDLSQRKAIYDAYLENTRWINNWDLVDASAEIVGQYIETHERTILDKLARSGDIWERRIAIVAPYWLIKQGQPEDTLRIAALLLHDKHDLIHKATGWMLREVGKRCSQAVEEGFLREHYHTMPRTMLRYAIERFEPELKRAYMTGAV